MPHIADILRSSEPSGLKKLREGSKSGRTGLFNSNNPQHPETGASLKTNIQSLIRSAESIVEEIEYILNRPDFGRKAAPEGNNIGGDASTAVETSNADAVRSLLNNNHARIINLLQTTAKLPPETVKSVSSEYQALVREHPDTGFSSQKFMDGLTHFLQTLISLAVEANENELNSFKIVLDDMLKLILSFKAQSLTANRSLLPPINLPDSFEPPHDNSYYQLISGLKNQPPGGLTAFSDELSSISAFLESGGIVPSPLLKDTGELIEKGLERPLNSLELKALIGSLGIDSEARISRSIAEKNFSSHHKFPPLRRILFNKLSSQLLTLSNNELSSEKYRAIKTGMEFFQTLFEKSSGSYNPAPETSMLSRLYIIRAAQSLNYLGVIPDSLNLIALEALLESDNPVTRDEIKSLTDTISAFPVKTGSRQEIKSLMKAALLLKSMKLNRSFENAVFISRIAESRYNLSRILSTLLDIDSSQALNLPDGIDKLHEITKQLSGMLSGKTVRFADLIKLSIALAVEVPQELKKQISFPLSQIKENDARKILQKVQTELNSAIEKISPAKLFSDNVRALIKFHSLERSISAVIAGKSPDSLQNIEEYPAEQASNLNSLERKIAARLIARQLDPAQPLIKKISNYLKSYSGADRDKPGTMKIERAVKAVTSRMPLNETTWQLLKPLDSLSSAVARSANDYLELISQSEVHTGNNEGMKGILELLIAISTGKPDQKSLIKMSSLLGNSTVNNRLINHSRAISKQVQQLTETVKNQLLRIKEEINQHSTKKSVKEVESLLKSLSTALERLEIFQMNNSRKEGLFQFILPFPNTPDDGQANFRFSKKESAGDDEDFSISLKLSPEPIGPIEISLRKLKTGVVATLIIKRREYLELISENIHLLTRRFESIGFGEVSVSCTVSSNPEVKRRRLTGLYA